MMASMDDRELIREFLEEIVDGLDLDATVDVRDDDGTIVGAVEGPDIAVFIGRHGQTIEAVQHLAQRALLAGGSHDRQRPRVVIDAGGYRARRREALVRDADEAAAQVERHGRRVALPAMTASERKLVHEYLRDRGGVDTHSEGEEPERHLVVTRATDPE